MIDPKIIQRIPLLRRPFYQRDRAIAERNALLAERNTLLMERNDLFAERNTLLDERAARAAEPPDGTVWIRNRPSDRVAGRSEVTKAQSVDDVALVERIVSSYRAANTTSVGSTDSSWLTTFAEEKRPVHDALTGGDLVLATEMLRNPHDNMLFFGFDNINRNDPGPGAAWWCEWMWQLAADNLLRLAEAIRVRRLENPEAPGPDEAADPEAILRDLDSDLGFTVKFPNPFPGEIGLATSRGVVSYRAVQALFQAWRIAELVKRRPDARVLEIGAGLGRTAYFAQQFGLRHYTIIDLPMTNVAQGYFIGRTLGQEAVSLYLEDRPGVRILPPAAFFEATDRYDLVVNVDSLTEMALETARAYCGAIKARAATFLSINHEHALLTVGDICADIGMVAESRTPYWLRRGYVDEVFSMGQ